MSFFRRLFKVSEQDYRLKSLLSSRHLETYWDGEPRLNVICDLDKTYLETEFESWIKMARIPFEQPHEKITVPGAGEVLEYLRWGGAPSLGDRPRAGIHFVSSSPPQLRLALDGKLALDGLEWSSDTFKNQGYNLRMGRIDLLRHHIAYKTRAILDIALKLPSGSRLIMFGDNAENDAFIYTGVRLFLERKFNVNQLREWLRGARVEESVISQVVFKDMEPPEGLQVDAVYIRNVPGYQNKANTQFSGTWYQFDNWAQVFWILIKKGMIAPKGVSQVFRKFHNEHGVPLAHLRWCLYQVLALPDLAEEIKDELNDLLSKIMTAGASGPTRRILNWSFEIHTERHIGSIVDIEPRKEASIWYQSIQQSRKIK